MKFIIGKKIDMTQIWQGDKVIAVTRIEAGPCTVTQVKNNTKDGYEAVQLGFGSRKLKNIKKPQINHFKKVYTDSAPNHIQEVRTEVENIKLGDIIKVDTFEAGDIVRATGISKGKGFQGVVKKYGFKGQPETHGTKDQVRMPGSSGATGPAHVMKGMRMGGQMGNKQITTLNLEVAEIDKEKNIIYIKGSVPGARNSIVYIHGDGELKISEIAKPENEKNSEKAQENTDEIVEISQNQAENKEEIIDNKEQKA